jgi:HAD superfamily phosphatase (TIGR01668 family)
MIRNNMFINYFKPSLYVSDFSQVNLKSIKRHGIKVFISDLDNTLVPHFKKLPTPEVFNFVKKVQELGFIFVIVSNNSKKRTRRFAEKLGVDYYGSAFKPFRTVANKIAEKYDVEPYEMVIMGDQLITDVLFANRCHMESILVQPLISDDIKFSKFNRFLEKFLYRGLERKNILQKGRFDDKGTLGDYDEIL